MLKPSLLDISHLDHPAISISVSKRDAKLAGTRDGALLEVVVNNALPCVRTLFSRSRECSLTLVQPIPIEEITVLVSGRENSRLTFSESVETLPPGRTTLELFCPVSVAVTFRQ